MSDRRSAISVLQILLVSSDSNARTTLSNWLAADGHEVVSHASAFDARGEVARTLFDAVLLDLRTVADDGLEFVRHLRAQSPWTKLIVIVSSLPAAQTGLEPADYLLHPFTRAQVQLLLVALADRMQLERRAEALQATLEDSQAQVSTRNAGMLRTVELARRLAGANASILIRGEVGVGKRHLARVVHAASRRAQAPLAIVNCQARSADPLEAELFGQWVPDATGLPRHVLGRVPLCDGGTLVLHEIGGMPPSLQPRLLDLIRNREYERLDDFRMHQADVRVIATSSADLQALVRQQHFRADLQAVVEVATLDIPPLRERREDIDPLARQFLRSFARENRRHIQGFARSAMRILEQYSWPGNIRELRNIVERAVLLCDSNSIELEHLPPDLLSAAGIHAIGDFVGVKVIQEQHILRVASSAGSIREAASILGLSTRTVSRLVRRHAGEG